MRRLPTGFPLALALWSLLIWGVRIRNAGGDIGPTLLALSFVVLAVAVLFTRAGRIPTLGLAAWTMAVWLVRIVDIAFVSDRAAAFVLVHATLGLLSIILAVGTIMGVRGREAFDHGLQERDTTRLPRLVP